MHSELQSHIVSYQRSLHEREVQQERITQLRVQLQTEELMMTSLKRDPRNLRKREASCDQRARFGDISSKRKVAGINSVCFLEKRSDETYRGGVGAKHEEDSRRKLFAYCEDAA